MKISSFIIGLVLVSAVVVSISLFYADLARGTGASYDNTTFDSYAKINDLKTQSEEINQTIGRMNQGGMSDYISGFLKGSYQVLDVTRTSFGIFTSMSSDATNKLQNALPGTNHIWMALGLIAFITFIFIIISVLTGRDV